MSPKLGKTSKEILKTIFIRNDNGMIFWDIHHSTPNKIDLG